MNYVNLNQTCLLRIKIIFSVQRFFDVYIGENYFINDNRSMRLIDLVFNSKRFDCIYNLETEQTKCFDVEHYKYKDKLEGRQSIVYFSLCYSEIIVLYNAKHTKHLKIIVKKTTKRTNRPTNKPHEN